MTWPSYNQPHWCWYRRLQGSTNQSDDGTQLRWTERCRCSRSVDILLIRCESIENVGSKTVKTWRDKDGLVERITGDGVITSTQ